MTHSQINQAKAWGFSRKPLNLNHFGLARHERFNVGFADENPSRAFTGQTKIGDFS